MRNSYEKLRQKEKLFSYSKVGQSSVLGEEGAVLYVLLYSLEIPTRYMKKQKVAVILLL